MSRTLGVSRSGFYAYHSRPLSNRQVTDDALADRIAIIHEASKQTYGAPRIHAELAEDGIQVGRKRIERLMKAKGLRGVSRRKFVVTTERDPRARPASDLVDRNFYADAPNVLWVADITYVPTWAGFLYLAVVLDAFSRRIIALRDLHANPFRVAAWTMGNEQKAKLVIDAMNMAVAQRKPDSVIHHSDQGSQYTSVAFGLRCKEMGVRPSMGSVGDFYDNAPLIVCFANECRAVNVRKLLRHARMRVAGSPKVQNKS